MIHLESGACESGIDIIDLNESAAMCFQWKAYLDEDFQSEVLGRRGLQSGDYPFNCPNCDERFTKMSGLFQHVFSKACDQELYKGKIGKVIKWLENGHRLSDSGSGSDSKMSDDT